MRRGVLGVAVMLLAGCGGASHASTAPTTTSTSLAVDLQSVIKDASEPLIADFQAATPPKLSADDTYYQQWQAAQPFVGDTLAAEHELDQVRWPGPMLASESKVYSDLQQIHDLVAAQPAANTPGAVRPFSPTFGADSNTLFGDLQTLLDQAKAAQ